MTKKVNSAIASKATRVALVKRAHKNLPDLVYRTMRMEGEHVTKSQAKAAVKKADAA